MITYDWQQPAAQEMAELLSRDEAVQALVLKGSLAEGAADRWSDVDLTVILADEGLYRYAGSTQWLAPLGKPFALQRFVDGRGLTLRLCLEDFRRFDLVFVRRSTLGAPEQAALLSKPHLVLLDRLRPVNHCEPWQPPLASQEENIDHMCGASWFKAVTARCKLGRGDHLIAAHLALEVAGDSIVLQMIQRDRRLGVNIHRFGGREAVPVLDRLREYPGDGERGILWLILEAGAQLDAQAAALIAGYEPRLPLFRQWALEMK